MFSKASVLVHISNQCLFSPLLSFLLLALIVPSVCVVTYSTLCANIDIETCLSSSPTVSPYHTGPCNTTPKQKATAQKKEPRLNLSTKLISLSGGSGSPSGGKIVREDSHCGLLENSCDDLSEDDDDLMTTTEDESQQMEYYFDGETIIQRKCNSIPRRRMNKECRVSLKQFSLEVAAKEDVDFQQEPSSLRNSGDFGSVGCLPCTPTPIRKPGKKMNKVDNVPPAPCPLPQAHKHDSAAISGNNWCCGVVAAASPRKTKAKQHLQ